MAKTLTNLAVQGIVFVLASVSCVFALTPNWTNTASDRSWKNTVNWDTAAIPTSSDDAKIKIATGPKIDSTVTDAAAKSIALGGSTGSSMEMTGGTISTVGSWFILGYNAGETGTFTMSGGQFNIGTTFYVGFSGTGTLYMNGGTLTASGTRFGIAHNSASAVGSVYLNGGTINCQDFVMANLGGTARLDITNGILIINGDKRTNVTTYKNNGWITAFAGSGTVNIEYNGAKTTVSAVGTLSKATIPSPANGAANVPLNTTLSWSAGAGAISHNVYFGTSNPLAEFKGNQSTTTYNPGPLAYGTTYYWRIDETGNSNTLTGDLWSFTTVSSTPSPMNVHLSWDDSSVDTTMVVTWATASDANSVVRYGPTSAYGSQKFGTRFFSSACGQYIHTVKLTGLVHDTRYHYSCGAYPDGWSADAAFTTGPAPGKTASSVFALGGDTRNPDSVTTPNPTYAANRIEVMNAIMAQNPNFFFFLGDWTDRGRNQDQWNELFSNLAPQLSSMPYMMCWGSHEDPNTYRNACDQFTLPLNGIPAEAERFYSFDYGNVHFSVLFDLWTDSSIVPNSVQYTWLQDDLAKASADPNIEWKCVLIHAPPYSTATRSGGGSNTRLRTDVCPLFDQYNVDVVFTAHEHNFERTHLIKNDLKVVDVPSGSTLTDPAGILYYVSGGAGAGLNSADGNAWFSANYSNVRHFLLVEITGPSMTIKAIQANGSLIDQVTINHTEYLQADFNKDGHVDNLDLYELTVHWLDSGFWP